MWLFAACDVLFAAVYALVPHTVAPPLHPPFFFVSYALALLMLGAAAGSVIAHPLARRVAVVCLALVGAAGLAILAALVLAVSYLGGIYGAVGQGLAFIALVAAALVVELYLLLPGFQIARLVRTR